MAVDQGFLDLAGKDDRGAGSGLTWTALWKMPPTPMPSLKKRLILRTVLLAFSESERGLVTSYTWSTTSLQVEPELISPASSRSPDPVTPAAAVW